MLAQDAPVAGALCPGSADVVLAKRLEHAGPDHPRVERREQQGERDPGENHVVGPVPRPAARIPHVVVQVAVAADREEVRLEAEEVRKDQPEPDGVSRDPDEHQDHQALVEEELWVTGADVLLAKQISHRVVGEELLARTALGNPPAVDAVRAAPRGALGDLDLVGGGMVGAERRGPDERELRVLLQRAQRERERHLAEAVMVTVGLAVHADRDDRLRPALTDGAPEPRREGRLRHDRQGSHARA